MVVVIFSFEFAAFESCRSSCLYDVVMNNLTFINTHSAAAMVDNKAKNPHIMLREERCCWFFREEDIG